MSKRTIIVRNIVIGFAGFFVIVLAASLMILRTNWFRDYARHKIIDAAEDATGGRGEIGSLEFDPRHLRAVLSNFVVHGREPAGSPPYLRVRRAEVDIRLFTSLEHLIGIAYLGLDRPEANILVFPDGTTNVPSPKTKPASRETPIETVVDMAIGHLDLSNGLLTWNSQQKRINISANNLRMQLAYNTLKQGYEGSLSLEPLYVANSRNTPVSFTVTLPVTIQRDRIELRNAKILTARSQVLINGSAEELSNPRISLHLNGQVALADLNNAGNLRLALSTHDVPAVLNLEANATVAGNAIQVAELSMGLGHSSLQASGPLKGSGGGSLDFKAHVALGEVGRLAALEMRPDGFVALNGTARLDGDNNYQLAANIEARDLSVHQGSRRIDHIGLVSAVHMNPHRLDLQGLRLAVFGADLAANASLADWAHFKLDGNLQHLNLSAVTHFLGRSLPYDGVVSGPVSFQGNLKASDAKEFAARGRLSIMPGHRGIPVSGRVTANYSGATGDIEIAGSYIALPHSRLNVSGSLGSRLNVALTSRDLRDLLGAFPAREAPPVALNGGQLTLTAAITGPLPSPSISGHLAVNQFQVEARQFDALEMDLQASRARASAEGSLIRGPMHMQLRAAVGLRAWKATFGQGLSIQASILNGDLADAMAIAGLPSAGYSGALTANARVTGTIGNPRGTAALGVANGTISNEPFDSLQLQIKMDDQLATIPDASLSAGAARIHLTAEFHHPRDSFASGQLKAHLQSNSVDLSKIRGIRQPQSSMTGQLQIDTDLSADISQTRTGRTEVLPTAVNGAISARGLRLEGQDYGDLTATARTSGQTVNYTIVSDLAGSRLHVAGNTRLTQGYPTAADVRIAHLPVERALALAKQEVPAKGSLSATAHFEGTIDNPRGTIDLDLANAVIYGEPVDHISARAAYATTTIDVPRIEITSGPSRLELTAHYDHVPGNLQSGDIQFRVNSSHLDLARLRNVQKVRPGLAGTLQIAANGAATVRASSPCVALSDLNADVAAKSIAAGGKHFGDAALTAHTSGGRLEFTLDSSIAGAVIQSRGSAQLGGDYPVAANLTFNNLAWTHIEELLGTGNGTPVFDALAAGQADLSGPIAKPAELRGSLQLSQVRVRNLPASGDTARPVVIQNDGPITATLNNGTAVLKNMHLIGPQLDVQAHGTFSILTGTADATVKAHSNLTVLREFNRDVLSSGEIALSANIRGTTAQPQINGRLELHDSSINYVEIPVGITKANGVVLFTGNGASVQNLTAEVGGGKFTLRGYAALRGALRFGLHASATNVRVRLQQGVSVMGDANIQIAGGTQASMVTGSVTVDQITYAPVTDFGSILSAAPPVHSASPPSPLLNNMKLDIQVRTSPSVAVRSSLAENLGVDANLQVRGAVSQPGVLGRVSITQGKLLFFGSTYDVNTGTISFYNPIRIEPVLNLSLDTQAKGVDVELKVTGPIDNMTLSYTSNPPLQFEEIVNLLATGKTPTSDPNLLVNQPTQPPQSLEQMGESALLSKALADPVASRLQRVFGVSQLSIDPTFTGGSGLPQAQVTLQQKISNQMTFTYITALNDPNTQIVRVEWALNSRWSAIAGRDQNGIVSLRFLYKKQFR